MHGSGDISPWVELCATRYLAQSTAKGKKALDLACGAGRHSYYLASLGFDVTGVDINPPEKSLSPTVCFKACDLEGETWPLTGCQFDLIVVTNYLFRDRFSDLLQMLKPQGGAIIYETFMQGNEKFGSPRRPEFLLQPGELLQVFKGLSLLGFEQGLREGEKPAVVQRAFAISGHWSEIQSKAKLFTQRV